MEGANDGAGVGAVDGGCRHNRHRRKRKPDSTRWRVRVVHLMGPLRASGMERMFVSGAPYFHRHGITSTIVGQGRSHPFRAELEASGYQVRAIPSVRSAGGLSRWSDILRDLNPEVVHVHTEEAFAAVILIAHRRAHRARIIRTFHSYYEATGWWAAKRRAQATLSDRYVDAFVVPTAEMAQHEARFRRRCVVIPNWVEERFTTGPGNTPSGADLLIVGNCEDVKMHETVLAAAIRNQWTVAHVGDEAHATPREARLLEELQRHQLLEFRGVADPRVHMLTARLFVLPSRREGFSVALAEAVAMGMHCVVTDIRGVAWAREAPLVSTMSSWTPQAWDDGLAEALARDVSASARESAREFARERLSAEAGVRRYCDVYRSA